MRQKHKNKKRQKRSKTAKKPRQVKSKKKQEIARFRIIRMEGCNEDFYRQIYKATKALDQEIGDGLWAPLHEYLNQVSVLHHTRSTVLTMQKARYRGWLTCRKDVTNKKHARLFAQAIGTKLPESILKTHCGDCIFWVEVDQCVRLNAINIICRTLHKKSTGKGTRYYSGLKVPINRVPMRLMFSQHAKDRIVQRCRTHIKNTYNALCIAAGIVDADYQQGRILYQETTLRDDYALELYIQSDTKIPDHSGQVYWKLVYLPCRIEKNIAHIPTVLIPGMFQTAEHRSVKRLPKKIREEVIEEVGEGLNLSTMIWLWFMGEEMVLDSDLKPILAPKCKQDPQELLATLRAWDIKTIQNCFEQLALD